MKKKLNGYAFVLFLVAGFFAVWDAWAFYQTSFLNHATESLPLHANVLDLVRNVVESILYVSGTLFALGVMIELLDQIRWDALHRQER
jgi:TRAP-type C4-dicarboxylate transport system permease small subunit